MKKSKKLNCQERQHINMLREQGFGIREIARELKRDPSTVSRELKRNKPKGRLIFLDCVSKAKHAQELTDARRKKPKKKERLKNEFIRNFVEKELKKKRSPRHISQALEATEPKHSISHEAIYQWIYKDRRDLIKYLTFGKRKRDNRARSRGSRKKQAAAPKTNIAKRPKQVIGRKELGHWEGDTIVSRQSKDCLFVLTERATRFSIISRLENCTAEAAYNALLKTLYQIPPELRKTLTLDNGSENACHDKLSLRLALDIYFCDPYSSWQKGSVENANGCIRRFFPKKTDFSNISDKEVKIVQDWLNTRRMDCLNKKTPAELFKEELAKAPNPLELFFPGRQCVNQSLLPQEDLLELLVA